MMETAKLEKKPPKYHQKALRYEVVYQTDQYRRTAHHGITFLAFTRQSM